VSQRLPSFRFVRVKFLGPTDKLGSRYKATGFGRSVTLPADYSLTPRGNALRTVEKLVDGLPVSEIVNIPESQPFKFLVKLAASYALTFTAEA